MVIVAAHGEKQEARANCAAVERQALQRLIALRRHRDDILQYAGQRRAGERTRLRHHELCPRFTTKAVMRLPRLSGGMSSSRSAPLMTRANTGAATVAAKYWPRLGSRITTTVTSRGSLAGAIPQNTDM